MAKNKQTTSPDLLQSKTHIMTALQIGCSDFPPVQATEPGIHFLFLSLKKTITASGPVDIHTHTHKLKNMHARICTAQGHNDRY